MGKTIGKFVIIFSVFLEVVLLVATYLACKNAPPRDDMPDFAGLWIGILGMLSFPIIFFLNITFVFTGKCRKIGHLVIALTPIVTVILMIQISRHFSE